MGKKVYRLSQKKYPNPALEILRRANIRKGICYVISIADTHKYKVFFIEDAFKFLPISNRASCDYFYFVGTIVSGLVWTSGDGNVEVWMENKGKEVII